MEDNAISRVERFTELLERGSVACAMGQELQPADLRELLSLARSNRDALGELRARLDEVVSCGCCDEEL